jgi:hypothetical protein
MEATLFRNIYWFSTDYRALYPRPGVGEHFWVLPQNIFMYNDITPRPESEEKQTNCF